MTDVRPSIWDEIEDLQKANGQLTDRLNSLEKVIRENSCKIGRMSAILEVTEKTAEEAMKKKPTIKESLPVEKDSKKEFWEYVLSDKAEEGGCRGFKGGDYCNDRCPYGPDGHRSCRIDSIWRKDKNLMQARARKELGLEEPEKMLYQAVDSDNDLCVCYGNKNNINVETLWYVRLEDGRIKTTQNMPDLWTEWHNNGCKFDPTPIKWKGKCVEREYYFEEDGGGIDLATNESAIINLSDRRPYVNNIDTNIHTDHEGRAFIV
jgi:hypothetical protein